MAKGSFNALVLTLEQYAEHLYGITSSSAEPATGQDVEEDIESSIQREIDSMAREKALAKLFTPVYLDLQCVLFFKTKLPIIPVDFVQRICKDASNHVAKTKVRFVNRLTPMMMMAKATEKGLEDMAKIVLREHFQLACEKTEVDPEMEEDPPSVSTSFLF